MNLRLVLIALSLSLATAICDAPPECHCTDPCEYWNGICNGRCANGWWGPRCDRPCSDACKTCNGGSAFDCLECFSNAYWDSRYGCKCYDGYAGSWCSDEQHFDCHPKCYGGCNGPADTECFKCVPNASLNQYGRCICDATWAGDDCTTFSEHGDFECDNRCTS
jgi:hypothetical protein